MGLWVHLGEIKLDVLTDVGRPILVMAGLLPGVLD